MAAKDKTKGIVLLLITALIWGVGFSVGHIGMGQLSMYLYSGLRCMVAGSSLIVYIMIKKNHGKEAGGISFNRRDTLKGGIACGLALFVASSLQNYGIAYASAGKTSFITSLYIVFVPIINLLIYKSKISGRTFLCIGLSLIGLYFLSFSQISSFDYIDIVVLLSAIAYAVHIVVISHWVKKADPTIMSCIQMWVNGILALTVGLIFEEKNFSGLLLAIPALLYSGVVGTGIGFTLQINAQKKVTAELATIIMSLESVFGAIFGYIILGQTLSIQEILGCAIVFVSVIVINLPEKRRIREGEERTA